MDGQDRPMQLAPPEALVLVVVFVLLAAAAGTLAARLFTATSRLHASDADAKDNDLRRA
jgi:hypothetical protein